MRTVLVVVRTPLAAQTVAATAARLGLTDQVRTAVNLRETLDRLDEEPAEVVLADTAVTRPDSVGFTRQVLARSPGAQVVLFGAEDPRTAAAAVAVGARGVLRGVEHDLVSVVAKAMLLVLMPKSPTAARTRALAASLSGSTAMTAVRPARSRMTRGPDVPMTLPAPRSVPQPAEEVNLRKVWELIKTSSLGSGRDLARYVDPARSARVAALVAGDERTATHAAASPDDLHFLLLAFIKACYDDNGPEDPFAEVQKLATVLTSAGRLGLGQHLWRLAVQAGDERARIPLGRLLEDAGRHGDATEQYRQLPDDPAAHEALLRLGASPPVSARLALTERELQVLQGMADGKSNADIGRDLFVSEDTVKTHARRLFRKLGARDRAHAVAGGFRHGLIQ